MTGRTLLDRFLSEKPRLGAEGERGRADGRAGLEEGRDAARAPRVDVVETDRGRQETAAPKDAGRVEGRREA